MKNYSTMNTMQCFSSNNSLSNSSKDSKQMFLTTRREPLIPPSNYHNHLQNVNQSVNQSQNYPCVHPHHTVLSSSCSPSISSNSINIWATINSNAHAIKQQNDKVQHYSALNTLGRLNTLNTHLHKQDESHKNVRWRTNEKKFCFLLLIIGCILTFILLIFALIFYFVIFKQGGISFGIDITNDKQLTNQHQFNNSTNLVNSGFRLNNPNLNNFNPNNLNTQQFNSFLDNKLRQQTDNLPKKKRKRLINKIEGELRILNKKYKINHENEVTLIKQTINYFIQRNLNLCLNNTEITQYRRGNNHDIDGIIINFILNFDCALPNLSKKLAFLLKESLKTEFLIDFRTLRLTPIFDSSKPIEYVDVLETGSEHWLKFTKNSEWTEWSDWSNCDCKIGLVVKSRQRTCLNKTTNKSAFSFSCGNNDEENDEHSPSLEIKNCDCTNLDLKNDYNQNKNLAINNQNNLNLAICSKCERTTEICLSYNTHMPNCLKILNPNERCGGLCNSKGTECKFLKDKNMYQCLQVVNETVSVTDNSCLQDEFRCTDGLCIPNIKRCDGHFSCFDSSDEENCQCDIESGEYMHCGNQTSCIHINKLCDNEIDCWDSLDEENCFTNCPTDEKLDQNFFHCASGHKECISIEKYCDTFRDCKDGSDEIDCTNKLMNNRRFNLTETFG